MIGAAKLDHDRHPGATSLANDVAELTRNERSQFRRMADHPEIVEQVIADSADSNPPSRRVADDARAGRIHRRHDLVMAPHRAAALRTAAMSSVVSARSST